MAERGKCSMSFCTIYMCLINASVRAGIWELRSSRYLFMSLFWWSDRVRKRAGDNRIEGWMYLLVIVLLCYYANN